MTETLRAAMERVSEKDRQGLTDICLYCGRPPAFVSPGRIRYLKADGTLMTSGRSGSLLNVSKSDLKTIVSALAQHSVHTCDRELRQGFFNLPGGIRVGVAGVYTSGGILKDWNALDFRFASAFHGCADKIYPRMLGSRRGLLICGSVNSGKTTMIRELCRLCGDQERVSLIDERGEISAICEGEPQFDIGLLTSVISGISRSRGIVSAVRTLSPSMIFCDELASVEDAEAVNEGSGCGVRFAATMHARDMEQLLSRRTGRMLIEAGAFDTAVFLEGSSSPGKIRDIHIIDNAS